MSRRLSRPRPVRRGPGGRTEPTDDSIRLRARDPADLLALIPFKLGFYPQESLVAVFVRGRRIELVARMDLPPADAAAGVAGELAELVRQNHADELVLFAYSEKPEPARAFLTGLVRALPARLVLDALYVDRTRWWSLTCDGACCPAEGTPYDVEGHHLAAEAVFAGLTTLRSREELAATVAGPPETDVQRLLLLAQEVRAAHAERPVDDDLVAFLLRRVEDGLTQAGGPDDRACTELAVLVDQIRLRDLVWAMIDSDSAEQHVALWQRVVSRVAPTLSAAPLALLGMAGWISGNGALLNCTVDELSRRHPSYSMGHLLEQISARAIPPRLWSSMRDDVHADLHRELGRLAG